MTSVPGQVSPARRTCAYALTLGVLVAGLVLAWQSDDPWLSRPGALPDALPGGLVFALLAGSYLLASRYTLDFEVRNNTQSVTLMQLPLALGAQLVMPLVHVAARVASSLLQAVVTRQDPLKAAYNVGVGCFEVGAATFAVSMVPATSGPSQWLALYLGLLVGDVVGTVLLAAVWRLVGVDVEPRTVLRTVVANAPVTLTFTGLAVVALVGLGAEPLVAPIMLGLVGALALAYRAYRKMVAQQAATERLYLFVRELGPLQPQDEAATAALDSMRLLLHAEQLDLTLGEGSRWRHLVVHEGRSPRRTTSAVRQIASGVETTGTAELRRGAGGDADSMATPVLGSAGLVGVLTATARMGNVRSFDMRDLRLLETVGAELSTALERGQLLADLGRAATTDELTGLPNLAETTRQIRELLAAHPAGVVLAAVAVDSFREVNDTLGHEVGDELLVEVTRRLHDACPDSVVGRIGGGRFAVVVSAEQAGDQAEMFGLSIRAQVEGNAQIGAVGTHVKLSVGVVRAPDHGVEAATLLRRAETAMYSARGAHGGPVLWEPAYEVQGTRRLAVVMALREALSSGAIGVAYQPKVETATGRVSGVEALARWTHPALGAIAPDEFIPLAEASGLMGPLTASVLRQSLTACRGWQRRAPGVGVAVNVSADTVLDPSFVTEVAAILTSVDVPPALLTLELTEGVVVHDAELAVVRMQELRDLGVTLSVDDFGTGYSSLTYLKGLPVDEVKIDKGFIDQVAHDPADRAVVRAVVDIAHTLGLRVVAEGVEQEGQQDVLLSLGVDEVQGYLHARPMPAAGILAWLRHRNAEVREPGHEPGARTRR